MATAMLIVPVIDALAKHLSATIPAVEIAWLRFVVGTMLLVPFVVGRNGLACLRLPRLWLHFLRGAGIAGATAFFFAALAFMPLADVAAIFFVEPLILTLFCAIFLGERIGIRRISAVLVGFGGAMLIIRPGFSEFGAVALLPLGAAVCFAVYMTITKILSNATDPWTLQALANVSGMVTLGIVVLVYEPTRVSLVLPNLLEAAQIMAIGCIALCCHTLIILALKRVSAAIIAPFQYLEIIGATFWGYLFFSEFPDSLTWLGIAIIVASGIFIFHREHKKP
jgi:S-adenosylmethionine uptake transporter